MRRPPFKKGGIEKQAERIKALVLDQKAPDAVSEQIVQLRANSGSEMLAALTQSKRISNRARTPRFQNDS